MRERLMRTIGSGWIRAVHALPPQQIDANKEEESMEEAPNFVALLREGMTVEEREEQLRFCTDAFGKPVVDEFGTKTPRMSFVLRRYALDPAGPVKADPNVVQYWSPDQLIQHIMSTEAKAGLLQKKASSTPQQPKEKKEKQMPFTFTRTAKQPAAEEGTTAETTSAVPEKAKGGKVGRPAGKPNGKNAAANTEEQPTPAAGGSIDVAALEARIIAIVDERVARATTEITKAIGAAIGAASEQVMSHVAVAQTIAAALHNPEQFEQLLDAGKTIFDLYTPAAGDDADEVTEQD